MRSFRQLAIALLVLAAPYSANELTTTIYFVDVAIGDDANGGESFDDPWKTLTRAAKAARENTGARSLIYASTGVYSTSSGEVFPIELQQDTELAANGGRPRVEGDSNHDVFVLDAGPAATLASIVLDSVDVVGGQTAISASSDSLGSVVLRDVLIADASVGLQGRASLVRTTVVGCGLDGIRTHADVELIDSRVHGNADVGIRLLGGASATISRTEVLDNRIGIEATDYGNLGDQPTRLDVTNSLIATNIEAGVRGVQLFATPPIDVSITGSTITANGQGLAFDKALPGPATSSLRLRSSIAYGNATDLATAPGAVSLLISTSNVGGLSDIKLGNLSTDPLFVDALAGDFRLRPESPCVDAGSSESWQSPELGEVMKIVDGDFDTLPARDMGAFEFEPVTTAEPQYPIGTTAQIEVWTPQGAPVELYFSLAVPLPTPLVTPFGGLQLNPAFLQPLGITSAGSGVPESLQLAIPATTALAGLTVRLQGLVGSAAAPAGLALSPIVEFSIVE